MHNFTRVLRSSLAIWKAKQFLKISGETQKYFFGCISSGAICGFLYTSALNHFSDSMSLISQHCPGTRRPQLSSVLVGGLPAAQKHSLPPKFHSWHWYGKAREKTKLSFWPPLLFSLVFSLNYPKSISSHSLNFLLSHILTTNVSTKYFPASFFWLVFSSYNVSFYFILLFSTSYSQFPPSVPKQLHANRHSEKISWNSFVYRGLTHPLLTEAGFTFTLQSCGCFFFFFTRHNRLWAFYLHSSHWSTTGRVLYRRTQQHPWKFKRSVCLLKSTWVLMRLGLIRFCLRE